MLNHNVHQACDVSEPRPLHLHTVESLCAALISGRPVLVGASNNSHMLARESARSVLGWYFKNRAKWGGHVVVADMEAISSGASFDHIPAGYHGPLYAEISPCTFSILAWFAHASCSSKS